MATGADKFELTLNLQEIIVLFFVMVALFTGLLFFGYRVGNAHSQNAVDLPPTPVAPAQEQPRSQPELPAGVEIEPEIRLENTVPGELNGPSRVPVRFGGAPEGVWLPLAEAASEAPQVGCKTDDYWSFLRSAVPSKHRFFERLAEWAGVPAADDAQAFSGEPLGDTNDPAAADGTLIPGSHGESQKTDCGAPVPRRSGRSVAC